MTFFLTLVVCFAVGWVVAEIGMARGWHWFPQLLLCLILGYLVGVVIFR